MKKLGIVLLLAVFTLSFVFANGAKEESTTNSGVGDALVIYTSNTEAEIAAMTAPFMKLYPDCEIEIVNGSFGELFARLQAEKDDPVADIMLGGLSSTDGRKYESYFMPYTSSHNDEQISPMTNGYYSVYGMSTACFAVNTRLEKELGLNIRTYEDLLNPALKGKIIFSDPNSSSAAWNNLCNIFSVYGVDTPEAWSIIEGLMRNGMVVGSSSSKCFKDVANGEYVVGITYDNGAVTMLGAPDYEMRYPENGTSGKDSCFAIIANCKHPEAAKAFVEAMTSQEGTELMYSMYGGVRFTNAKVTEPDTFQLGKTKDIKWVDRPVEELTERKDELLAKWNDLYSKIYK
ncbi:MAG: extracellular solute-binding protein [Spirochaetales bacterium]|nr:extracellular solute-binding protein [Spirochaetales bacterium]